MVIPQASKPELLRQRSEAVAACVWTFNKHYAKEVAGGIEGKTSSCDKLCSLRDLARNRSPSNPITKEYRDDSPILKEEK